MKQKTKQKGGLLKNAIRNISCYYVRKCMKRKRSNENRSGGGTIKAGENF